MRSSSEERSARQGPRGKLARAIRFAFGGSLAPSFSLWGTLLSSPVHHLGNSPFLASPPPFTFSPQAILPAVGPHSLQDLVHSSFMEDNSGQGMSSSTRDHSARPRAGHTVGAQGKPVPSCLSVNPSDRPEGGGSNRIGEAGRGRKEGRKEGSLSRHCSGSRIPAAFTTQNQGPRSSPGRHCAGWHQG